MPKDAKFVYPKYSTKSESVYAIFFMLGIKSIKIWIYNLRCLQKAGNTSSFVCSSGFLHLQGVLAQYDFWDLEKIALCEIRTSGYYLANFPLGRILLHSNSTSTNFIPIALKFVLVEIVLVETVLVGDPLYLLAQSVLALLWACLLFGSAMDVVIWDHKH